LTIPPPHRPTFSAVIANYNHSDLVVNTLDAALNQTVPFDEIIIIDDASTDNSIAVIERRIAGHPHARLIKSPKNQGVVATANLGVREATGDFIFLMAADDDYNRRIVEWCRPIVETYPDIGMICGNIATFDADTGAERHFRLPFPQKTARYTADDITAIAKKRAFSFFGGSMLRRETIIEVGLQRPELKWSGDWLLYLLMGYRRPFAVIPETFIRIRMTASQFSNDRLVWKTQAPVIETFLCLLRQDYPNEYTIFRRTAVLPSYDIQALFMLLRDPTLRHYLTPLLVWRLITFKALRSIGRLLPDTLQSSLRQLLRV
jgi:glycosyltransferase involved in cell wall biosynthesis